MRSMIQVVCINNHMAPELIKNNTYYIYPTTRILCMVEDVRGEPIAGSLQFSRDRFMLAEDIVKGGPYDEDLHVAGAKDDDGKNRMGLFMSGCSNAIGAVSKVLTFGANKYTPNGWQTVPNAKERYTDAFYRHMNAYHNGELIDPDSGEPHLAHAATNIMFLLELDLKG